MTPVVAISKPAIVAATTDMGIIIFDSDSCSPSWVSGSVIISGLVPGISVVDMLVCVGGGCVVDCVGDGCVVDWVGDDSFRGGVVGNLVGGSFVDGGVVGCNSVDSENNV